MLDKLPLTVYHEIVKQSSVLIYEDMLQLLLINKRYTQFIRANRGAHDELFVLYGPITFAAYRGREDLVERMLHHRKIFLLPPDYDLLIQAACEGKQWKYLHSLIENTPSNGSASDLLNSVIYFLVRRKLTLELCDVIVKFSHLLTPYIVGNLIFYSRNKMLRETILSALFAVKDHIERIIKPDGFLAAQWRTIYQYEQD